MRKPDYGITAVDYLHRAIAMREGMVFDMNPARLLYAALEFRLCIERTLFEYLYLIKAEGLSKKMEDLYTAKRLRMAILEGEPEFVKKLEFVNLMLAAVDYPSRVQPPDLDKIEKIYGLLNDYLHAPKRPEKTEESPEWWNHLLHVLQEAEEHLSLLLGNQIGHIKLNERGGATYDSWKKGLISDEQVMGTFRQSMGREEGSST